MDPHPIHGKPDLLYRAVISRHPSNIAMHRLALEGGSVLLPLPRRTRVKTVRMGGARCKWITGHEDECGRTILYLHGGGYIVGSMRSHKSLAAHLCRAAAARALLVDYRRAPEHPFPAALEDAYAAYLALLDAGVSPDQIAIAGDSAGGGLSLALLLALKQLKAPMPAAAYLMSPWVDLTPSDLRFPIPPTGRTAHADWFADFMAAMYVGRHDPTHPFISPVHGDLSGLPPMFIAVGRTEPLWRQCAALARKAREHGVDVAFGPYRSPVHVLQALAPFSKRIMGLLGKGGAFIQEKCPRT